MDQPHYSYKLQFQVDDVQYVVSPLDFGNFDLGCDLTLGSDW